MYHPTKETREKMRQAHLGKFLSPDTIEKMRQSKIRNLASPEAREKASQAMKKCWQSPLHRERVSQSLKKRLESPEARERQSQTIKKRWDNCNTKDRERISQIIKKTWESTELREKARQFANNYFESPGAREKARQITKKRLESPKAQEQLRQALKKRWESPESKEKQRQAMKKHWGIVSPDKKDEWMRNTMLSNHIKPNKPEIFLTGLLETTYPNEWKYVGNGEVMICGRSPDFININGSKAVILLHGVYWHLEIKQKSNPILTKYIIEQEDMNFYKTYGWDCLIIWDDELKSPEKVLAKLKRFSHRQVQQFTNIRVDK